MHLYHCRSAHLTNLLYPPAIYPATQPEDCRWFDDTAGHRLLLAHDVVALAVLPIVD